MYILWILFNLSNCLWVRHSFLPNRETVGTQKLGYIKFTDRWPQQVPGKKTGAEDRDRGKDGFIISVGSS